MNRVAGKVAIVTGGAGGIGSATAARLAEEGARVAVTDVDGAAAERVAGQIGRGAIGLQYDARDAASISAMVDKVVDSFGGIDILHNNAALTKDLFQIDTNLLDTDLEIFDTMIAINLRGTFAMSKAVLPHMLARGGGSVINMGSGSSERGAPLLVAYTTSKSAILGLTRSMATQYGRQNVRTNCILPGLIMTETAKAAWGVTDTSRSILPALPFHRDGRPDDIAGLVLFLASDEGQFMNGEIIACDGGFLAGDAVPLS